MAQTVVLECLGQHGSSCPVCDKPRPSPHHLWGLGAPESSSNRDHSSWPLCRRGAQGRSGEKPSHCWWPGQHVFQVQAHGKKCGSCAGQLFSVWWASSLSTLANVKKCGKLRMAVRAREGRQNETYGGKQKSVITLTRDVYIHQNLTES